MATMSLLCIKCNFIQVQFTSTTLKPSIGSAIRAHPPNNIASFSDFQGFILYTASSTSCRISSEKEQRNLRYQVFVSEWNNMCLYSTKYHSILLCFASITVWSLSSTISPFLRLTVVFYQYYCLINELYQLTLIKANSCTPKKTVILENGRANLSYLWSCLLFWEQKVEQPVEQPTFWIVRPW